MKLPDESTVSRYEKGLRVPSIELLLLYHHLFDTSIESFFELQSQAILKDLSRDIQCLIEEIQKEELTSKNTLRIKFLEEIIIKLTNWIAYEYNK